MKFLVINTDYPRFLEWLYAKHPGLENQPYEKQEQKRIDSLFGVADFYSRNLEKLGNEAWTIFANNEPMQRKWAKENGILPERAKTDFSLKSSLNRLRRLMSKTPMKYLKPFLRPLLPASFHTRSYLYEILSAQIKSYMPDVLLNQSIGLDSLFFREHKAYVRLLVGQHASPLPQEQHFGMYDLMISSLPNFVDYFRRTGLRSEMHRLGFESSVLKRLDKPTESIGTSFVGNLYESHGSRKIWLDDVCRNIPVDIWGESAGTFSEKMSIIKFLHAPAWGLEMYRILHSSRITLNHHIDISGPYANNMRLFEATGVGTLLVTDWKKNLPEMFEPGKEVIAYRNAEECIELIRYYLENEDERRTIAKAGQRRTLSEHTYYHRMEELLEIVKKYLK